MGTWVQEGFGARGNTQAPMSEGVNPSEWVRVVGRYAKH